MVNYNPNTSGLKKHITHIKDEKAERKRLAEQASQEAIAKILASPDLFVDEFIANISSRDYSDLRMKESDIKVGTLLLKWIEAKKKFGEETNLLDVDV